MFTFCYNVDEEWEMYLKSTNIIVNSGTSAKQLMEILYYYLFENYQENMIEKIRFWYSSHKVILNREGPYKKKNLSKYCRIINKNV